MIKRDLSPLIKEPGDHALCQRYPVSSIQLINQRTKTRHRLLVELAVSEINRCGFRKDYTIISLAQKIGSNETTLKYAFKSILNTTIYKFYQDKRMDFAINRLKSGRTVGEVSIEVGYSFVGHFSHAFKNVLGCARVPFY